MSSLWSASDESEGEQHVGMKAVIDKLGLGTPQAAPEFAVLMVCMGNICRSPTAEQALRQRLQALGLDTRVRVDSAGTHGYHTGSAPDERAIKHAKLRGLDMSKLKARRVLAEDFLHFDLVLAMDEENFAELQRLAPEGTAGRVKMLMDFARDHRAVREVPDPYYGSEAGFERVLDLVSDACDGLAAVLARMLRAPAVPARP
jgi:protein-tyrosine phosphatase